MKKFKTSKQYNKYRKQFLLGKDSTGNKLYPGDYVEINNPTETKTSWCSRIHWNYLDGAFVDSHPAHIQMKVGTSRELRSLLENWYDSDVTIKKVTQSQFESWGAGRAERKRITEEVSKTLDVLDDMFEQFDNKFEEFNLDEK